MGSLEETAAAGLLVPGVLKPGQHGPRARRIGGAADDAVVAADAAAARVEQAFAGVEGGWVVAQRKLDEQGRPFFVQDLLRLHRSGALVMAQPPSVTVEGVARLDDDGNIARGQKMVVQTREPTTLRSLLEQARAREQVEIDSFDASAPTSSQRNGDDDDIAAAVFRNSARKHQAKTRAALLKAIARQEASDALVEVENARTLRRLRWLETRAAEAVEAWGETQLAGAPIVHGPVQWRDREIERWRGETLWSTSAAVVGIDRRVCPWGAAVVDGVDLVVGSVAYHRGQHERAAAELDGAEDRARLVAENPTASAWRSVRGRRSVSWAPAAAVFGIDRRVCPSGPVVVDVVDVVVGVGSYARHAGRTCAAVAGQDDDGRARLQAAHVAAAGRSMRRAVGALVVELRPFERQQRAARRLASLAHFWRDEDVRLLTLTQMGRGAESCGDAVARLDDAIKKLMRSKLWKAHIAGSIVKIEVERSTVATRRRKGQQFLADAEVLRAAGLDEAANERERSGLALLKRGTAASTWHAHAHLAVASGWWARSEIQALWEKASGVTVRTTRDEKAEVGVRIEKPHGDIIGELTKYITKPVSIGAMSVAEVADLASSLAGRRLLRCTGAMRGVVIEEEKEAATVKEAWLGDGEATPIGFSMVVDGIPMMPVFASTPTLRWRDDHEAQEARVSKLFDREQKLLDLWSGAGEAPRAVDEEEAQQPATFGDDEVPFGVGGFTDGLSTKRKQKPQHKQQVMKWE